MKINQYKLSDFHVSNKAIWLVSKWSTPEVRQPSLYKNIFIPVSQVAFKPADNLLYIPDWLVESIHKNNATSLYKYQFPTPILVHNVEKEKWEYFKSLYPFKDNTNTKGV